MKASVLKPGLLVSLKTSIRGGVNYQRVDLEHNHTDDDGALVARWETKRQIVDPAEYERATVTRGKARTLISSVCCSSSFGLLCPVSNESRLDEVIAEARALAAAHNAEATVTQVEVFVLVGRISSDDAEAARAIGSEVRELLDDMKSAIDAADPARIREAASKARELGSMLSPDVASQVTDAIVQARSAAREIVKRVEKSGESAARVVASLNTTAINMARFAFLDMDAGQATTEAPAGRSVEIEAGGPVSAASAPAVQLEV